MLVCVLFEPFFSPLFFSFLPRHNFGFIDLRRDKTTADFRISFSYFVGERRYAPPKLANVYVCSANHFDAMEVAEKIAFTAKQGRLAGLGHGNVRFL